VYWGTPGVYFRHCQVLQLLRKFVFSQLVKPLVPHGVDSLSLKFLLLNHSTGLHTTSRRHNKIGSMACSVRIDLQVQVDPHGTLT
jgi:hypothetical protein